jgi:amino acid adenylation domain-containing protein
VTGPLAVARSVSERLVLLARERGIDSGSIVEAAFAMVLGRHLGQVRLAYEAGCEGDPPARRVVDLAPDSTLLDLARRVSARSAAEAAAHSTGARLVLRGLEPHADPPTAGRGELGADAALLVGAEMDGEIALRAEVDGRLFDTWTAGRLLEHLRRALVDAATAPGRRLDEVPLVTDEERRLVLDEWNRTEVDYRPEACIHTLFEEQAALRPAAPAVLSDEGVLTYAELDVRANRLAHHLVGQGAVPGAPVGLCLERSADVVVALLAILKAGAAYLPLDPAYPRERLAFMLSDARAPVVVTARALSGVLPEHAGRTVLLDGDAASIGAQPGTPPQVAVGSGDLAYVVYTSGSTGAPKGVEVRHRSVNRLVCRVDYVSLGPEEVLLHAAPLAFDASTFEIWGALLNGGRCAIYPESAIGAAALGRAIERFGVTTMFLTTALFNALVDEAPERLRPLRQILFGGERVSVKHVRRALEALRETRIVHVYGPTEVTTFATAHPVSPPLDPDAATIPIGRPIRETRALILDERLRLAPIGAVGELYLGGEGLARGYLGRPDLTAERFLPDPFGPPGARLYRTGDLARWHGDGIVEFVGRADDQVKLRGFRIELGEVEAALARHPAVRGCAVALREDVPGVKRLVAYAQAADGSEPPAPGSLREFLLRTLPPHMIPAAFVWLPALPLNANGKVDRRALPAPRADRPELAAEYVEPSSGLERRLAKVFSDVLGVERVGIRDGFFDLGGDSLLALRAIARIQQQTGVDLPVIEIFQHPTVEALAARLSRGRDATPAAGRGAGSRPRGSDVAVVGMAGRFPGANSVEQFWKNVCEGVDSTTFFADAELDPGIPTSLRNDPAYVKARGIVEGFDQFDAAFFGVSPKEAELMDPQQRLLLEVAWEALERAGHAPATFSGATGIFAGKYFDFYWDENVRTRPDLVDRLGDLNSRVANDKHFIATRVAHKLDLTGPAISVHSACSTSLVAVCQAVQSLRSGECDLAIAGGASITVPVRSGYLYQEGSMLSPDGRCRPFDARASGTTFSDGVAVVVLRRLEEALADGDTVFAVIRGAAVNNDGARRASFTAPSVDGQVAVIGRALADAGVEPRSVSYVEAHGTATPLGDPIEVEALTRAFRAGTSDSGFCAIGSVKSNVGHLVVAAGAAGLIKAALSLHHRLLAPMAHFQEPNPHIDFEHSPFRVQSRLAEWAEGPTPRRAGVSAFGVGGTNAHVVLEEAPPAPASGPSRPKQVLLLSARSPKALETATHNLRDHLRREPRASLADVAFTLQAGRQAFAHRSFLVCDEADATAGLDPAARRLQQGHLAARAPSVVFLFPGQGAQHADMARNLHRGEPVFRAAVDRCSDALADVLDRDLRSVLYPDGDAQGAAELLRQTAFTQPALFTVSYALACLWRSWGVEPEGMIGHSVGEFVCAALAGVLGLEDAVRLVAARGRLMQGLPPGAMLSASLSADAMAERLRDRPAMAVASDNAPGLCVASGPADEVARLQRELEAAGVGCRPLVTSHAFHSPMMDPAVEPFAEMVRRVRLEPPRLPFVSTATGTWITSEQATDPAYWAGHLRATVRFAAGVRTLLAEPGKVLLEVGPRATLSTLARRQMKDPSRQIAIASLGETSEANADYATVLHAAGQLWLAGADIDWSALHAGERRRRVVLPTYPFERKRYWLDPAPAAARPAPPPQTPVASSDSSRPPAPPQPPPLVERPVTTSPPPSEPRRLAALRELLEEVTGLELAAADPSASFVDLGLDSLFLTQAALQVQKRFGVKVTFRQLMESLNTLGALAAHLDAQLPPEPADAPPAAAEPIPPAPAPAGASFPPGSAAVPAGSPAEAGLLKYVIDQQLRLMAQQLALVGGSSGPGAAAEPRPASALPGAAENAVPAPPPAPAAPPAADDIVPGGQPKYDVKTAFGAIARISTSAVGLTPKQRARLEALTRRYNARTKESKRLTQENRAHLADPRAVTGFKPLTKELTYQVIVERSSGSHLWDVDGNEYVDALCGFGACYFGWQPPFVTEAVRRQLDLGHEIGPMTPLAGEVAKLVCEFTGFDRAGFCNTGSEAVMGTMRIARTVTGRSTIVTFGGSYHGIFDEVIVRGTKRLKAIPAAPGILPNTSQNVLVLDYGTPESLEIIRSRAGELAAVLVEPIQSRRPDFQPREFLHEVRRITDRAGAALVFDEVVNGFRTCPGGAQEYFGIGADLASYGKVIGGGFPIGIIAGKHPWIDALDGGLWRYGDDSVPTAGVTYFAGTFCRHPLALAAAKASLLYLKERGPALQRDVSEKTARLAAELNARFERARAPIHVKHFASLWKPTFTEDLPLADLLFVYLRDRGVHILEGFPCFLTTAHTQADVDFIVKAFEESVAEMQEAGFLPGPAAAPRIEDASAPPVPGARLGRDRAGNPAWYVPNPAEPGKYIQIDIER